MDSSGKEVPKVNLDEASVVGSSVTDGSTFSEENPLIKVDPASLAQSAPKKPQAVALHGWQRTVAIDEHAESTVQVRLGAPGTGLTKVPQRHVGLTASCTPLDVNPQTLRGVVVTREDKKEAKSLRALPVAPGAAPLPVPRVASETDESLITESLDTTALTKRQNKFEHPCGSPSSTTSSDLNFLVKTSGNSSLFGTRPSFGRAVEPRIPATVGEERLHDSLTKFFTQVRREGQSAESSGESRSSSASQDKERSGRGTMTSTPVTKSATRESSLYDSPSKSVPSSNVKIDIDESRNSRQETKHDGASYMSRVVGVRIAEANRRAQTGSAVREKQACTRPNSKESILVEDILEDGLNVKVEEKEKRKVWSQERGAEESEGTQKCGCFSGWPWKVRITPLASYFKGLIFFSMQTVEKTTGISLMLSQHRSLFGVSSNSLRRILFSALLC